MKLKRKDLFDLKNALTAVGHYPGVKFAYAVATNLRRLEGEIADVQKAAKPATEYEAYEKARIELCTEYAEKQPNDEPVIRGNQYVIPDDKRPDFDAAMITLAETHAPAIEARKKQEADFDALLLEEIEIDLYRIAYEVLPEAITGNELTAILAVVADPLAGEKPA